ncbi:MAG: histidine phosphatase family protein [Acetobacteraceae bacterium]
MTGRIYCSPSAQCLTPARFAVGTACRLQVDPRLVELDFGVWEEVPWDVTPKGELDAWARDPENFRPGGGESVSMLQKRLMPFWQEVTGQETDATVVTHGGPSKILMALAEGRNGASVTRPCCQDVWRRLTLHHRHKLSFDK